MSNADIRTMFGFVGTKSDPYCPQIDRLIQSLRKSGEITAMSGKWHLADRKKCNRCGGSGWLS